MGNEFNKTEADFAYERYTKMGGVSRSRISRWKNYARLARLLSQVPVRKPLAPGTARWNLHWPVMTLLTSHRSISTV